MTLQSQYNTLCNTPSICVFFHYQDVLHYGIFALGYFKDNALLTDSRGEIHRLHAKLCNALADPHRILILNTLIAGRSNVSNLAEEIGLSQSSVSRHLKVLRESSLVFAERRGHSMIYQLADERVVEALDLMRSVLVDNLIKQAALARTASERIKLNN